MEGKKTPGNSIPWPSGHATSGTRTQTFSSVPFVIQHQHRFFLSFPSERGPSLLIQNQLLLTPQVSYEYLSLLETYCHCLRGIVHPCGCSTPASGVYSQSGSPAPQECEQTISSVLPTPEDSLCLNLHWQISSQTDLPLITTEFAYPPSVSHESES